MDRKLTTIVAMDAVGYSAQMESDEIGTFNNLKNLRNSVIDPAIANHGGRIFKLMGDGILAEFSSAVGGLQCAVDIQNELTSNGSEVQFRIGIHVGDVIVEEDDIYGDGVNIAARLEGIAPAGGIVLSKQVYDHIGERVAVKFVPMGEQRIKNISRPIEVYKVDLSKNESISGDVIRFSNYTLDTNLLELQQAGKRIAIEPRVFDLLVYLAQNSERTVTKEEIFAEVWNGRIVSDSALSSQIKAARKALGDDGKVQHTIRTIHGRGFRFVAKIDNNQNSIAKHLETISANAAAAVSGKPSVAVLPFSNLGGDVSENYFSDGITEDITTALSKNRWLIVVARNSAFAFRDSAKGIRGIGEALEANYLITGSLRKVGNRVRITIEVVDVETENSVWSERFDRDMVDIFDLQDEITELVTSRIESELGLTEQRKAGRRPRKNLGAWDLYQLGVAEFYKFTRQSNQNSQDLLKKALLLDSEFASAYSRLAYAIVLGMVYFDAEPSQAKMDEALIAAKQAIKLDDEDANSYFTIGRVYLARREYDLAIDALEHALSLNPCLAVTYCGLGDSLAYEGRLDEAIQQFEMAIRLSPHDPFRWAFFSYRALAHLFRQEFQDAVLWARKSVEIPNAQYWASAHLVAALGHLGDTQQAKRAVAKLKEIKPEFSITFAREHLFYLKREDQIDLYLTGLKKAGIK